MLSKNNTVTNLGRSVQIPVSILRGLLPLNGYDKCFYCGVGSKPDEDMIHFDADNCWHGDQKCLQHSYYDDVRKYLIGDR